MSDKRCPYCGGIVENEVCTHCGAHVSADRQVDADRAGPLPTAVADSSFGQRVPWERREELGWWQALIETLKMLITQPSEFFSTMSRHEGYGGPLLYGVILGSFGGIIGQIFNLGIRMFGLMPMGLMGGQDFGEAAGVAAFSVGTSIIFIVMTPIFVAAGLFINAGILHLMLMIVGGANEDFETTFRVASFSQTAQIAQVVPLLGGIAAAIWGIYLQVVGLVRAQEISAGKALLAIFLPMIFCCVIAVIIMAFAGAAIFSSLAAFGG